MSLDRRQFLTALALSSAAPLVLAACGKSRTAAPASSTSTAGTPAPSPSSMPVVAFVPPKEGMASETFIGEIRLFAASQEPAGWVQCAGQLVPINDYQALSSILGETHGGDGKTTFALPDLRRATPLGIGPEHRLGQRTEFTVASGGADGDGTLPGYLAVNFCIAFEGTYPSRN
jgi:hypothetical protein